MNPFALFPWPYWALLLVGLISAHQLMVYQGHENVRQEAGIQCDNRITAARKEADLALTRKIAAVQELMTARREMDQKAIEDLEAQNDDLTAYLAKMKDSGDVAWTPEMVEKMGGAQ